MMAEYNDQNEGRARSKATMANRASRPAFRKTTRCPSSDATRRTRALLGIVLSMVFGCANNERVPKSLDDPSFSPGAAVATEALLAADGGSSADAGRPEPAPPRFLLPPATTARLETLVPPAKLANSENAAFTADGRFFVAGAEGIYEIEGGPNYTAVLMFPNPGCVFGGVTSRGARLYAPCTSFETLTADLIVLEPARHAVFVSRAPIVTKNSAHFNGSAFGPDGALYLSNSLAVDSSDPAVVRLEFLGEEPLRFMQSTFVESSVSGAPADSGGGFFPNGVRFHGDTLYLVRGPDVAAAPLGPYEPGAVLELAYKVDNDLAIIDDFDIGDERMWLTQFNTLRALGLGGESKLVVTDLVGNVQFSMDLPFTASSTVVSAGTRFGPACILLTSYFDGGLYRVTFE